MVERSLKKRQEEEPELPIAKVGEPFRLGEGEIFSDDDSIEFSFPLEGVGHVIAELKHHQLVIRDNKDTILVSKDHVGSYHHELDVALSLDDEADERNYVCKGKQRECLFESESEGRGLLDAGQLVYIKWKVEGAGEGDVTFHSSIADLKDIQLKFEEI